MSRKMPDEIAVSAEKVMEEALVRADFIVNRSYLPFLEQCGIEKCRGKASLRETAETACFFPIHRIVFDKKEDILQKLASVYSGAAATGVQVAFIVRGFASGGTELYLGVCDERGRMNGAYTKASALRSHLLGQLPGCRDDQLRILSVNDTHIALNKCFDGEYRAVSAVSCIASLRKVQMVKEQIGFYQGIEKVIDAMYGSDYTILILAQPLSPREINQARRELEELYANLSPFAKISVSGNQSQARTASESLTESLSRGVSSNRSVSLSTGVSTSDSTSTSESFGLSGGAGGIGAHFGLSFGSSHSEGESSSTGKSEGSGRSVSKTQSKGRSQGSTTTTGQSVQLSMENKGISDLLRRIDQQLARLRDGAGMGIYATAAYFLAPSLADANTIACAYKANISGDATNLESTAVNTWYGEDYRAVADYLRGLRHPVFRLDRDTVVTPATLATSAELALQMSMPQKSVNGISVRESVCFGRNVIKINARQRNRCEIPLGNIYHLGYEEQTAAGLDLDSLTMHTFVTGTTGSGKSNTIYGLIDGICGARPGVRFLVVEPAKGEYKSAFAGRGDVRVYGINPYITPLLRINPFRFRKGVHVLEHLDRLVSIFNVCWPMEAAMPAILKQALERAYASAGWDLRRSTNAYSEELFPTFADVMTEVTEILQESQYSDETRGNYVGALCTRLRELTTGLNGMIFVPDDLTDRELFEENVIIDLSRIGSAETKSLIMGLIVVRLQEYRQTLQTSLHTGLRHLTVLEEAHHLLRRSAGAPAGGADLVGKSVEMLTNAFAEMRSAGEAFMIADQSPGLMDMSVIRNTNTKIIMRLPAQEDRELVGRAIGLNDLQIMELAKLPTGVAAVYQNDWLEPVLIKLPYYTVKEGIYKYTPPDMDAVFESRDEASLLDAIMLPGGIEKLVDQLKGDRFEGIGRMNVSTRVKRQLINYLINADHSRLCERMGELVYDFFNLPQVLFEASTESLEVWKEDVLRRLEPSIRDYDPEDQRILLLIIANEYTLKNPEFEQIYLNLFSEDIR